MFERGHIKKVLITGGTSGLGLELARLFLKDGAEVYATGRKWPQSVSANSRFHFIQVDFADLKQVKAIISEVVAETEPDLVINNAGILSPNEFIASKDGFEYTFQVNFLAHLLIGEIIARSLNPGKSLTLAFITSPVYKYVKPRFILPGENNYQAFRTYCETKFYLLLAGSYLRLQYPDKDLKIIGLDPGIFSSGIYRMQKKWFHKMYAVGALFMRSSGIVAGELYRILNDQETAGERIYHRSDGSSKPFPTMSETAEIFLKDCNEALILQS
jgi:NAD(P)-dependent dehydrogenase (short-subunit alcohol dehydrogenase family)